ncbi:glycosyl transferase [Neorhizobium sp. P12A]|uniref:glycosyltransferase family 2 protein n=1 Tax=Neorhizobium sp. P12A TaxID=2268027 RepID=UPI0011EDF651|nr:glycosyltransferase family 2 protein [Neorhizobium sp. P12A]KAA0699416.1 glycosyl transferase [Neorhizobium sp. P12A]
MRIGEYPPQLTIVRTVAPEVVPTAAGVGSACSDELPSFLQQEISALSELGIGKPYIEAAAQRAIANGTSIEQELIASGLVEEKAYYAALARALRLPFVETVEDGAIVDSPSLDSQLIRPRMLRLTHSRQAPMTAIAPEAWRIGDIRSSITRLPGLKDSRAIASPSTMRKAVWRAGSARRVRDTIAGLFESQPRFSARVVFHGNQGFYTGVAASLLIAGLLVSQAVQLSLHVFLSLLYFAALLLRAGAVLQRKRRRRSSSLPGDGPLPIYTVMVALYREADIAGQLIATLKRLDWPASLLDIKLVCEADDVETIAALKAEKPGPQFEIIEVPPSQPRTKPKALTYALAGARGTYLAVYDAEDRPHPQQLREAHARFSSAPDNIACLQAPLVIANGRESWISALFSLEYSALFRSLLPMLATHRMPMPLGGTSNHFRTDILRAVGGWDPFNVTEDADLGMRLYRLGYRADVIRRQTVEDAPVTMGVWTRQRTRWFKGWLQTWLVMMRDPAALRREMGMRGFVVFQLLIGGMLLSSLAHPLILAFLVRSVIDMLAVPTDDLPLATRALFAIDFVNILGSYATFLVLGTAAMIEHEKRQIGWRWMMVPFYWMLVSLAAWRAVFELRSNPFFWHKTPHVPVVRKS